MSGIQIKKFLFYNFIIYDHDSKLIHHDFQDNNILFKSKKKLNPNTPLFKAVNEVIDSFIMTKGDLMKQNFPMNKQLLLQYVDKKTYYKEKLTTMITNISCNGFELKDFYIDKESTMNELDSNNSPISRGELIKIIIKDIHPNILMSKKLIEIQKILATKMLQMILNLYLLYQMYLQQLIWK